MEPDPVKIQYRTLLTEVVSQVVRSALSKTRAIGFVHRFAKQQVPHEDTARFIEVAKTQLMNLHEGNIAGYRLRPVEF